MCNAQLYPERRVKALWVGWGAGMGANTECLQHLSLHYSELKNI